MQFLRRNKDKKGSSSSTTTGAAAPTPTPEPELIIGEPEEVQQVCHVSVDPSSATGLKGLPPRWEQTLMASGLTKDQMQQDPNAVVGACTLLESGPKEPTAAPMKQKYPLDELLSRENPHEVYEERKRLDSGSSGEVFLGVRRKDGEEVAIKKIFMKEVLKELKNIENEISMMYTSRHPNVINFYDCYKMNTELWIVMEFMSGGKLTDLIDAQAQTGFTEPQIACICQGIIAGLAYLHGSGRIHRDIKSDNILINSKGEIKLGDFGFCAGLGDNKKRVTVVGTPYWMAPEVIKGIPYDFKADMWSMGILALELADGEPPLLDLPPIRALYMIVTQPPPKLKHEAKWSGDFANFMEKILQKDPERRQSAQAVLEHDFLKCACTPESFIPQMLK